jgi:hypothetical protein
MHSGRGFPDISAQGYSPLLFAHLRCSLHLTGGEFGIAIVTGGQTSDNGGGTSAATPIWAATIACVLTPILFFFADDSTCAQASQRPATSRKQVSARVPKPVAVLDGCECHERYYERSGQRRLWDERLLPNSRLGPGEPGLVALELEARTHEPPRSLGSVHLTLQSCARQRVFPESCSSSSVAVFGIHSSCCTGVCDVLSYVSHSSGRIPMSRWPVLLCLVGRLLATRSTQ